MPILLPQSVKVILMGGFGEKFHLIHGISRALHSEKRKEEMDLGAQDALGLNDEVIVAAVSEADAMEWLAASLPDPRSRSI